MMKIYFKILVATVFATNVMAQNVPSYVPKDGLVGWWPFNGNANDESGNGNHGTVNGATLTTDRYGKVNCAYSFDGDKDYIDIGNSNTLKRFKTNFTISAWIKPKKFSDSWEQSIISNRTTDNCGSKFGIGGQRNQIQGNLSYVINGGDKSILTNSNEQLSIDTFQFVSISSTYKNNTTIIRLYINNQNVIIDTLIDSLGRMCDPLNQKTYIGFESYLDIPNEMSFNGKIDDIAIYNRALSDQEIKQLYEGCNLTATITPQGNTTFCQGGSVILNANFESNYNYQWYNNEQIINGETKNVFFAYNEGKYTVKIYNGTCEAKSDPINITVNPLPNATISPTGNLASICEGGSLIIKATGGTNYKWNSGETTSEIKVTTGGAHYADVINEYGCKKIVWLDVRVNPNPKVSIDNLKTIIFKNENKVQLFSTPKGGVFSGEGIENEYFNPSKSSLGKKYLSYKYIDANGCTGVTNANVIVVDSIGNVCNITKYDTVKVTEKVYDTIKIIESTYDTLKIKVQLTTGIKAGQIATMNVFPNPTSDVVIIEASDVVALNGYSYKMVDLQGKQVYKELVTKSKTEISLKSIGTEGVYILHVVDAQGVSIENKKIVLE